MQLYAQLYYLPFFFEAAKMYTPLRTGVSLLPILVTLVPASVVVGAVITRTGKYQWAIAIGWLLTTLGTGLTITWNSSTATPIWAVEMIILGFGHGLNLNALNTASQAVSKPGDEGRAVGMYAFLRSFGMAIGVGVSGSVFQNVMSTKLTSLNLPHSIATNAEAYLQTLATLPDDAHRRAVISAYIAGFHGVFIFITSLSAIAFFTSLFIKHSEINKEVVSEHKVDTTSIRASWRFSKMSMTGMNDSLANTPAMESRDTFGSPPMTATSSAANSAMQSRERVEAAEQV